MPGPLLAFCQRHYGVLAAGVLLLSAFNLTYRLGQEVVTEWDESLYATSASEMVESGDWIRVTSRGALDYYNAKPPLNVWLIAGSFKAFGASLVSLRASSVVAAWITVAVLMFWTRRRFGEAVSLLSGVVLGTSFAFVYVHAGRSANPDALFTLLIVLTVITLSAAYARPACRLWLGPLAAAAFLLKGMAVLLPLALVIAAETWWRRHARRDHARWLAAAALLFLLPVSAWAIARWHVDRWAFFERLFNYDFVARSVAPLEGHSGGLLYYLYVLQKDQYDWLLAAAVAWLAGPISWRLMRDGLHWRRRQDSPMLLLAVWAVLTLAVPTLMRTKLAWYLNPFYPAFAVIAAWLVARGLSQPGSAPGLRRRRLVVAFAAVVAFGVAEGKLLWYSFHHRDLAGSAQGLLLAERNQLTGHSVFRARWDNADSFVLVAIVGGRSRLATGLDDFLHQSRSGDYLLASDDFTHPDLSLVRSAGEFRFFRRRD